MKFNKTVLVAAGVIGLTISGCSTKLSPEPFDANLRLTAGQVKMRIIPGTTSQQQVFRALGVPNVVALESGKGEVWTYDQIKVRRTAQGYSAGAYFGTIFNFGDFTDGGGVPTSKIGGDLSTSTTSVQTATLVIRFTPQEKVESYQMLVTSF